jgi:hypothetical protein
MSSLRSIRMLAAAAAIGFAAHGSHAHAQDTGGATIEVVEQLSSDYTAIAGGWWLDERCRVLAFDQKIEFEWLVGELTAAIAGELGTGWTNSRQQSAQDIAFDIPCDAAAKDLIGDSITLARVVTEQLTALVYTAGVTDREYLLGRYSSLAQGRAVADRCRFKTDAWRAEYRNLVDQIGVALGQRYSDVDFKSLATDAQLEVDASAIDCTPDLDTRIDAFYAAARSLALNLGLVAPAP